MEPTFRLFNGRLTFTFHADKYKKPVGTVFDTAVTISDAARTLEARRSRSQSCRPREKKENEPPEPNPKTEAAPSRPDIVEVHNGPDALPITVEKVAGHEASAASGQR